MTSGRTDRSRPNASCAGFGLDDVELAEGQERLLDKIAVSLPVVDDQGRLDRVCEASKSRSLSRSHCLGTGSEHASIRTQVDAAFGSRRST